MKRRKWIYVCSPLDGGGCHPESYEMTKATCQRIAEQGAMAFHPHCTAKTKVLEDDIRSLEDEVIRQAEFDNINARAKKSVLYEKYMADFLVSAEIGENWTVTFEFENGIKITKSYTNSKRSV